VTDGFRTERDSLGEVRVPAGAWYGAQTARAVANFPVSGRRLPATFVRAQAQIKRAAALANEAAGRLAPEVAAALVAAAEAVLRGEHDGQFVVDAFQAGAGTSQNMNLNEVLANLANVALGGERGTYDRVHPNDHANMAQSTNDTIHSAIHVAAALALRDDLLPALAELEAALAEKAVEFAGVVKPGRTHLQDAAPLRLGQEFGAWAAMMRQGRRRLESARDALRELCLGGTAVGTGLNADPRYQGRALAALSEATGEPFRPAADLFEAMQGMDAVVEVAGALRVVATSLRKIADDLRLLASGPRNGLGELRLPAVQPGSSIMPGKINPVLPEMLDMVCCHVMGLDAAVVTAAQMGQLELNVMMPIIALDLLEAVQVLAGGARAFARGCVTGIEADAKACRRGAERNLMTATALAPAIGYERAAELAREALARGLTVRELARERDLLPEAELDRLLDLERLTRNPSDSGAGEA